MLYPTELLAQIKSVERVTGIEPASPAWKAGALAIVLHPQAADTISPTIIAYEKSGVKCLFRRSPGYFALRGEAENSLR